MAAKHLEVVKVHEVVGSNNNDDDDNNGPFGDSNPRIVMRIYRIRAKKPSV
jgi:hypothetical protein